MSAEWAIDATVAEGTVPSDDGPPSGNGRDLARGMAIIAATARPRTVRRLKDFRLLCCCLALIGGLGGCGGSGGGGGTNPPSNLARFTFNCDLQGVIGQMTMDVEVIQQAGIVWGPGPNPDITGVIGSGNFLYITAGELVSPVASYVFSGENQFADFVELNTGDRFRVQWVEVANGLAIIVNPSGAAPTQQNCELTGSRFL